MRRLSPEEVQHRQRTKCGLLTEVEVARIKRLLQTGESKRSLAQAYGVSLWTIRAIGRGETWAWVSPDHYGEEPAPIPPDIQAAADASAARMRELLGMPPQVPNEVAPDPSVVDRLLSEAQAVKDKQTKTDELLKELDK